MRFRLPMASSVGRRCCSRTHSPGGWRITPCFGQNRLVAAAAVEDANNHQSLSGNCECDDYPSPVADDSKPGPDVVACFAPIRESGQFFAERHDQIGIPRRRLL